MTESTADGRSLRAQRMREVRREKILDTASQVFGEKGYHATTLADLIEAAGVSRGTFYSYFTSREAVLLELMDRYVTRLMRSVRPVRRDEEGSAMAELYANVERVVKELYTNAEMTRLLFREAVGIDRDIDARLERLDAYMYGKILSALRQGVEWNLVRKVDNLEVIAASVIGTLREVLYQSLIAGRMSIRDPAQIARTIFEYAFLGISPRRTEALEMG
jgi:AcrR family transcriptional regulator